MGVRFARRMRPVALVSALFQARTTYIAVAIVLLAACDPNFDLPIKEGAEPRNTSNWHAYGGPGGSKFVALDGITKNNVADLEPAWVYRHGDVSTLFQSTPILVAGQLVFCTPFNRVIALDPATGGELWTFDPQVRRGDNAANEYNCRGVAQRQPADFDPAKHQHCAARIFTATNDARLIGIDATTGVRCEDFGDDGEVDLSQGVGDIRWNGEYQVTSPPAIAGDRVIVGSAVSDGGRLDAPSGVVRAYDASTGALVWAFDLAPPDFDYANGLVSDAGYALGTPNVWSAMSVDADHDLVFLPTGNPAPDYFRPLGENLDYYGSAVIALRASTGEVIWHFNTVRNDFWDFDVPAQPILVDLTLAGERVPALIQSTKMGFIFVLNRLTGEPLVPIDDREVPRHGPLEHHLSPTQPYPPAAFQVSRDYQAGGSLLGLCNDSEASSVIGPLYTPITEQWTIGLPSNMGATNWGGVAVDPQRGLIAVRTSSVPFRTKLISRADAQPFLDVLMNDAATDEEKAKVWPEFRAHYDLPEGVELARQHGTDYLMARHAYLDTTLGIPCAGTPLGEVMVIDIAQRTQTWRRPHGTVRDLALLPLELGVPGVGGSLVTQTGLLFAAGTVERAIRAYDMDSGEVLWHHRLPRPGNATPMSYQVEGGRQYVVIAAGGDARTGIGGLGDYLVAFALPE